MTRINTNVSSLIAQNKLARNAADLQQALTRLSTGLRINVGKDDPAGLIASEALRSDITSIEKAVTNSERANQVIATADSALGQVSRLLNDIRGLVVEAANTGALSEEQIAANQLQVDSSLEAINRIAQTTTFQGRRLLDGSLDFGSTLGSVASVKDAQIDQANLGTAGRASVDVAIAAAATQAKITNAAGFSDATQATATLEFSARATVELTNAKLNISATATGTAEDAVVISFVDGGEDAATTAVYTPTSSTLVITTDLTATTTVTAQAVVDAINNQTTQFRAALEGADGAMAAGDASITGTTSIGKIQLQADAAGSDFNNVTVNVVSGAANAASYNASQKIVTVTVNSTTPQTLADIVTQINTDLAGQFTATAVGTGFVDTSDASDDTSVTDNTGNSGGRVLNADLVISIGGSTGREVFSFEQGASAGQIAAAINLVADATGVAASYAATTGLTLNSTSYGSSAIIDTEIISEGTGGTFESGMSAARAEGTDIVASINGVNAAGDGNSFSINTATLDMTITVEDGSSTNFQFEITGGGALFQLGPDVVSNQQARMGIQSLNTAKLGGASGRLHELASGGSKALATDPNSAFRVVDEVISKITGLRGRLGAFQRTTVETNIASLNDTLVNLTEAESSIRDADFAKESSALTRAQILVQSGTSVLAIANNNPQSVLTLLQ